MAVDDVEYENNAVCVNATLSDKLVSKGGAIILALYQNERLVAVHPVDISASIDYKFNHIPAGEGYTIKMFALKDLSKIEPICRALHESVIIM